MTLLDVKLDPPTIHALGVKVLTSNDDDGDAWITVRYRKKGESDFTTCDNDIGGG